MRLARALSISLVLAAVVAVSDSAVGYEETAVSGGGTITGKVVFNGDVPMRKIITTKDQNVCGGIREEPEIVVNGEKAVTEAVVFLTKIDKGKAWPAAGAKPLLDQEHCIFKPRVQVMPAGKLTVKNSDPVLHNTHGFYGKRTAFNMALPNQNQEVETDLDRAGTVRIECDAHGWMLGWIYVVDNPYYAVTGADGSFTIADVPPGDYTLVATHEFTGPIEIPVTVKAGEETSTPVELKKQ